MKKTAFLLGLLMLMLGATAWAQDSKIETGIIAYQGGEFKKALDYLNQGLTNKSELSEKNLPRAYYHRGMTRLKVMGMDAQALKGQPTKEQAQALEDLLMGAYDDFKQAKATDNGKWGKKVDEALANMNVAFLQAGLAALNMTYDKAKTAEEKQEAFQGTLEAMNYAIEISAADYFPFDLRGQAKLGLRDSVGAHSDFGAAAKLIEGNTHTRTDLLIAYTYYRKAILERYNQNNVDAALKTLDMGKTMLDREWSKITAKKAEMKAEEFAKLQKQYDDAKEDLSKFELDLLLNAPDKLQEAIDKFKGAISKEPNNYVLHVAYAQLLEKVGKSEEAAGIYETATKIDPSKQMAWFNLGAMYVNKAVALYAEANKISDDPAKAKALQGQADELFRKALPFLQKANEIDKCDLETLRALLQLTINLQMTEEYSKYKEIEKQCKAGQ
jgi:Tfp pilus assembly protein PilF